MKLSVCEENQQHLKARASFIVLWESAVCGSSHMHSEMGYVLSIDFAEYAHGCYFPSMVGNVL